MLRSMVNGPRKTRSILLCVKDIKNETEGLCLKRFNRVIGVYVHSLNSKCGLIGVFSYSWVSKRFVVGQSSNIRY